jgi:hypothetical protein
MEIDEMEEKPMLTQTLRPKVHSLEELWGKRAMNSVIEALKRDPNGLTLAFNLTAQAMHLIDQFNARHGTEMTIETIVEIERERG